MSISFSWIYWLCNHHSTQVHLIFARRTSGWDFRLLKQPLSMHCPLAGCLCVYGPMSAGCHLHLAISSTIIIINRITRSESRSRSWCRSCILDGVPFLNVVRWPLGMLIHLLGHNCCQFARTTLCFIFLFSQLHLLFYVNQQFGIQLLGWLLHVYGPSLWPSRRLEKWLRLFLVEHMRRFRLLYSIPDRPALVHTRSVC